MKRRTLLLLVALLVMVAVTPARGVAEGLEFAGEAAGLEELAGAEGDTALAVTLEASSGQDTTDLGDGSYETFASFGAGDSLAVTALDGAIGGLYICWYEVPDPWTLSYVDAAGVSYEQACGRGGFLHEYVDLEGSGVTSCTLVFPRGAAACTLDAYGSGTPPAGVQVWSPSCERADFLVCSTHADDEILWLGGVLATYAGGRGLSTQVVYMTNYWNADIRREHEKLDGLWAIGVRNYPVDAPFEDIYAETLDYAQEVYDQDAVTAFFTEQVRRFKPLVVVCQDFAGEYGHGGHQVLALAVQGAVDEASDASFCAESAREYGTWDVPKTYFHLYGENRITLDLHQPIAALGGMTAIEAQQEAYEKHTSQQWTWFYVSDDPTDPNAEQINCSEFGLYRSTVGQDTTNDMLEHLTTYEEQDARAQESEQESVQDGVPEQAETSGQAQAPEASGELSAAAGEADGGLRIPVYLIALVIGIVLFFVALLVLLIVH